MLEILLIAGVLCVIALKAGYAHERKRASAQAAEPDESWTQLDMFSAIADSADSDAYDEPDGYDESPESEEPELIYIERSFGWIVVKR